MHPRRDAFLHAGSRVPFSPRSHVTNLLGAYRSQKFTVPWDETPTLHSGLQFRCDFLVLNCNLGVSVLIIGHYTCNFIILMKFLTPRSYIRVKEKLWTIYRDVQCRKRSQQCRKITVIIYFMQLSLFEDNVNYYLKNHKIILSKF